MSLIALKTYLRQAGQTSLAELAQHFKADPPWIRQQLEHWIQKGCVKRCYKTPRCGKSCTLCDTVAIEMYEWAI